MLVRIKTWYELEAEFGLNEYGQINIFPVFTRKIDKELPKDRIISIKPRHNCFMWEGFLLPLTIVSNQGGNR